MLKIENDHICIEYLKQNRQEALAYLIKIYFPILRKYAINIIQNEAEAEDITEDVFIKIWNKRADFDIFSELKAFMYTSIKNASLNILRARKRENNRHVHFTELSIEDGVNEILFEELLAEIRKSIITLPPKMRQIFILSYYEKMSNDDIAAHLHLTKQTVKNQKTKAINILKSIIGDKNYWLFTCLLILLKK